MNSPLEQYIHNVARSLWFVPARWRNEQITEVRQHLTDRSEELMATGLSLTDAEEEATQRFGSASGTAHRLVMAWWRQILPFDRMALRAATIAFAGVLSTLAVTWGVVFATPLLHRWINFNFEGSQEINITCCVLWCLLAGIVAGRATGRRAALGVIWGGAAAMLTAGIYGHLRTAEMLADPKVREQVAHVAALAAQGKAVVYHLPISLVTWQIMMLAALWMGACIGANVLHRRTQRLVA